MKTKCKKCKDKGYLIVPGDIEYCDCAAGEKLKLIEAKRNQKGYRDNY